MRIAAIASMKKGMEHFVHRELSLLTAQGFSIKLFPTKYDLGLYNARPEWTLHRWNPLAVLLLQPYFFLCRPIRYLRLFWEAIRTRALVDFALAWHFARHMADVDVIYATFGDHKLFVGYFCKRIVQKPLAVTIHAYELYANPNPRLFWRALPSCDRIIAVTEHNKQVLANQYKLDPSMIELVRCSVDTNDYRPEKKFIILIVGFFVERKGHEVLFNAVRQLAQDDIEVWVVGGEGAESAIDVRRMASQLGIESQVVFWGKLSGNALKAVYRACDVFCLPCHKDSAGVSEGFPTVLIEAMAFGKPVITTRHVEIPRIIDEILVDEKDVPGLAQAIRQVYESTFLRQRLAVKNRRIAEEVFSTRNTERTGRILCGLADRPGRPRVVGRGADRLSDGGGSDRVVTTSRRPETPRTA
jgi:colanic acid/amylovoran biosynthesis glycosyltransferase